MLVRINDHIINPDNITHVREFIPNGEDNAHITIYFNTSSKLILRCTLDEFENAMCDSGVSLGISCRGVGQGANNVN